MNKSNNIYKKIQEKKKKELQDLLDNDAFSNEPNPGKTNEENFWIKVISFVLLFACGFSALAGRWLGEYARYVHYFIEIVFILLIIGLAIFLIVNVKKRDD